MAQREFFYNDFTKLWGIGTTAAMRTYYRTRLEQLFDTCIRQIMFVYEIDEGEWLRVFFKQKNVIFTMHTSEEVKMSYEAFYELMKYYTEMYLNKYWCSTKEKQTFYAWLDTVQDIAKKKESFFGQVDEVKKVLKQYKKDVVQSSIFNPITFSVERLEGISFVQSSMQLMEMITQLGNYQEDYIELIPDEPLHDHISLATQTMVEKDGFLVEAYMMERGQAVLL